MMDYLNEILQSSEITWQTAFVRIVYSFIVGTLIGIERETHSQPAGLRTHILISIGATIAMLVSIYLPQAFPDFQNGDPGRIAAQVVSGIGFLGAGAILKFGANVKGLTTAASIWAMATLGLAIGAGMYLISAVGVVVVLFALTVMDFLEKRIFKERSLRTLQLQVKKKSMDSQDVKNLLKDHDVKVVSSGIEINANEPTCKLTFVIGVTRKLDIQNLANDIDQQEGVVSLSINSME